MSVRGADMARAWLMTAVVVALASCAQSPAYEADAYELGKFYEYDIIILDLMLTDMHG